MLRHHNETAAAVSYGLAGATAVPGAGYVPLFELLDHILVVTGDAQLCGAYQHGALAAR